MDYDMISGYIVMVLWYYGIMGERWYVIERDGIMYQDMWWYIIW